LVDVEDCIGTTLKAGTLWDGPGFLQPITREYARLGTPGQTILDVGANIGAYPVWAASQGAWRVVAFEPVPEIMVRLKANLDLNREVTAGVVIPVEVAGYDREVQFQLASWDPHNWGGTSLEVGAGTGSIHGRPLDTYRYLYGERVSLVVIDAQGCDGKVLEGLEQTLLRDHPVVVFEWEADLALAHGMSLAETEQFLATFNYSVHPWPSQPGNYLAVWKGESA
jgi:FkbM family methyltransferase